MQIELWKDNAIEFRGKFCYMWLMVLKPIYKQFIESCIWVIPYQIDQKNQMLDGTISDFDETLHTCTSIWEKPKSKISLWSDLQGPSYGGWKFWPRGQNAFFQMPVD